LPCRRSWVRVPSSALRKAPLRGFFDAIALPDQTNVSPMCPEAVAARSADLGRRDRRRSPRRLSGVDVDVTRHDPVARDEGRSLSRTGRAAPIAVSYESWPRCCITGQIHLRRERGETWSMVHVGAAYFSACARHSRSWHLWLHCSRLPHPPGPAPSCPLSRSPTTAALGRSRQPLIVRRRRSRASSALSKTSR